MARYRQVYDPETKTSTFVEIQQEKRTSRHFVHGDIQPFRSPIDGKEISDRRQLREHNERHGVTNSQDYSKEFLAKRNKERSDRMTGNTKENHHAIGQALYDSIIRAER